MTVARLGMAIAATAMLAVPLSAQRFKSGVDIVRVDALVMDGNHPAANLRPADFELRDNGVRQTVVTAAMESLPISLVLVLDTSGSVAGRKMLNLASAVDVIVKQLRQDDRAG